MVGGMYSARFTLDFLTGELNVEGYTAGEDWNGWACPRFTRVQADELIRQWNTGNGEHAYYESGRDTFVFPPDYSCSECDTPACYCEFDEFPGFDIGGITHYAIGAWGWVWEEVETTPREKCSAAGFEHPALIVNAAGVALDWSDSAITNPFLDETGRFEVEPADYWGIPEELASAIVLVNAAFTSPDGQP